MSIYRRRKPLKNPLPTKARLRMQADALLQRWVREYYDKCFTCNNPAEVGHHFVNKAHSLALRYDKPNIIPMCKECHYQLHTRPWLYEPTISFRMGEAWFNDLLARKSKLQRTGRDYYLKAIEQLQGDINDAIIRRAGKPAGREGQAASSAPQEQVSH